MDGLELGIRGRTVVVAGAGGDGIGTGVSALLLAQGATVVGLDHDADALAITRRAAGADAERLVPVIVDVTDADSVQHAVGTVDGLPPLLGLVHVVGGMPLDDWNPITSMPFDRFASVIDLNLQSAFHTTQAVAQRLVEQGQGGSIVVTSSISGLQGMPFGAPYAAAKAALLAFMRTAALELSDAGVRVNAVAPGTVRNGHTAIVAGAGDAGAEPAIPLGRRGTPLDIAGAALYLLSDLAAFVTGHTLVVDGGASIKPSYLDEHDLPVFVRNDALRTRLRQQREKDPS